MARVERSIVINVPADAIEAATTLNPTAFPEWFAGVEKSEPDANYPNVGGTIKLTYKAAGLSFVLTQTLVEFDPGNKTAYSMDGMISGTQTWTVSPADGGTQLDVVFDYKMAGGGLGAIADKLVVERMNVSNLEKSLDNLKAMLEG